MKNLLSINKLNICSLQNSASILTEILTEKILNFDRIFPFWPKFWPTLLSQKNVGRNFLLTGRSKNFDRNFDRLTIGQNSSLTEILTESRSKSQFDRNFDRKIRSKFHVWPNFDQFFGQNNAAKIPRGAKWRENGDRNRSKSFGQNHFLTDFGDNCRSEL